MLFIGPDGTRQRRCRASDAGGKTESLFRFSIAAPAWARCIFLPGRMRFLARDQDSNVLASRGPRYRLVCCAAAPLRRRVTASREKRLDRSFRASAGEQRLQRGRVLFRLRGDVQGRNAFRRHLTPPSSRPVSYARERLSRSPRNHRDRLIQSLREAPISNLRVRRRRA